MMFFKKSPYLSISANVFSIFAAKSALSGREQAGMPESSEAFSTAPSAKNLHSTIRIDNTDCVPLRDRLRPEPLPPPESFRE